MKASVCIETIFTEFPFSERIRKAAEIGYDGVEFWMWEDKGLEGIRSRAEQEGIPIVTFQANRGGSLVQPDDRERVISGVRESLQVARQIGVERLFLLTDELGPDRSVAPRFPEVPPEIKRQSVIDGLATLAGLAEQAGVVLNLEVLNTKFDHPGYWLDSSDLGFELVREIGSPNLRLLFDVYHVQIMEGNLSERIRTNLDLIGHIHVADVPGRHEPGTGEINYARLFGVLREAGYSGYVGMEFIPTGSSERAATEALALLRG